MSISIEPGPRRWPLVRVLIGALILVLSATGLLIGNTLSVRYERDVSRMVFNDNMQLLDVMRRRARAARDSAEILAASVAIPDDRPYLVVSIADHRLWFRQGDSVLFETDVATGSGKVLEQADGDRHWRFETPRGRLEVVSKDSAPSWIAPDWHYVEQAQRRGLGILRLQRGQRVPIPEGGWIAVVGTDVVREYPDGRRVPVSVAEGNELAVGGNLIIPPFGTNQRKYAGVLGTHRINIGDGYALHGTNRPETIGQSVSHGCVRLRNEDIAALYSMVSTGTPVFIY